ncbi:MerR family transcriptional regulator [Nocardia terpenica]|uniref:MerR family transcriptional regulator n=1 Tax=Nocardia terpenica TaxID=455432 RepID=A0A6G9YYD2_9NOCA|nr:MerR family transcriptional regulator [Nocardia terpenica]
MRAPGRTPPPHPSPATEHRRGRHRRTRPEPNVNHGGPPIDARPIPSGPFIIPRYDPEHTPGNRLESPVTGVAKVGCVNNDGDRRYAIGELARITGLPVKTIRFYSDEGLTPPTERTPRGYRLYDVTAVARLRLINTLRELGIDIPTIRRALRRELTISQLAQRHADALDAQIRTLRLRRAVLRAVAERGSSEEEIRLMHKLAKLNEEERQRIIDEFWDATFIGVDADAEMVAKMRSAKPQLPDDPTPAQVDAWVEMAELVADEDFRSVVRTMAVRGAEAEQAPGEANRALARLVADKAGAALAEGIAAESDRAAAVLAEIVAGWAEAYGTTDTAEYRAALTDRLATFANARVARYWELMGVINNWPARPDESPAWEWTIVALRAHPAP